MPLLAVIFVLTLIFWAGIMLYAWACAYPMFRDVGASDFAAVHRAYERGLPLGVYVPFAAMALAVLAAFLFGPTDVPLLARWGALIALAGGVATTALCAAPMHLRLIRDGKDDRVIRLMLACNRGRAAFAALGLGAAIWTLVVA